MATPLYNHYTMQPGDFIINSTVMSNSKTFAIFEGKEIFSTTYASAKPDYSLLAYYESSPYRYNYQTRDYNSKPLLEIATPSTPCTHKVYVIENPSIWRKCTPEEKTEFFNILVEHGYIWDEETWSLIDSATGEIVTSIVKPKITYNGQSCKKPSKASLDILTEKCEKEAKGIYMYEPPAHTQSPVYSAQHGRWDGSYDEM